MRPEDAEPLFEPEDLDRDNGGRRHAALCDKVAMLRETIDVMRPGAGEQCLWCSRRGLVEQHANDCLAFKPDGVVR